MQSKEDISMRRPRRRLFVGAVVTLALGAAGAPVLAVVTSDAPDPSAGEPAPALNDPDLSVAVPAAERVIAAAGRAAEPGSAVRVRVSGGAEFGLWRYATEGGDEHMLVDPSGRPVSWLGCRRLPSVIQVCGSSVGAGRPLVITGAAAPQVASVRAVFASGDVVVGTLAGGSWIVQSSGQSPVRVPTGVEALAGDGTVLATGSTESVATLVAATTEEP
jgi:hypothetical protein